MKDHVESWHLTKFDALGVNRDQVMDLETYLKIRRNVSNVETASPSVLHFYDFCDFYKKWASIRNFHLKNFNGFHLNLQEFIWLGDAFVTLNTFV